MASAGMGRGWIDIGAGDQPIFSPQHLSALRTRANQNYCRRLRNEGRAGMVSLRHLRICRQLFCGSGGNDYRLPRTRCPRSPTLAAAAVLPYSFNGADADDDALETIR